MLNIEYLRSAVKEHCRQYRVTRLDLIGSASRGDFDPERSDFDFIVSFDGQDRLFDRFFEFKAALEQAFQRPVDILQPGAIRNPHFRHTIEQDRILLYET